MRRHPYLDWLRGIAVLIMIEAHTLDSWTRAADRQSPWYQWAIIVAGYGAPIFLFLAGITLMLAAGGRLRQGTPPGEVTRAALRRGAWILALAFLFRLQSFLISGGPFPQSLFKVDILNVMGVAMLAGALGWSAAATSKRRVALFAVVTVAMAMLTPLIRVTGLLDAVPEPIEAYFRPVPGFTNFTLFPWAGFFSAGCASGVWLDARRAPDDGRLIRWLAAAGVALVYGVLTSPIHRRLPFPVALLAFAVFAAAMFGLVRLKEHFQQGRPTKGLEPSPSSLSASRGVSGNSI